MNILVQRINISNNENRKNIIINKIFIFIETNIVIWFFICMTKSKLNKWIPYLSNNNKYINDHRHLGLINILHNKQSYERDFFNSMNLTNLNSDDDYKIFKNKSTFNYNDEEFQFINLLYWSELEYYCGKLKNLTDKKNKSNIDLKIQNSTILKLASYGDNEIYIEFNRAKDNFKSQQFFVIYLSYYFSNISYFFCSNINELNIKNDNINKKFIVKGLFHGILFDNQLNNKINLSSFAEFQFIIENKPYTTYDNKTYNKSLIREFNLSLLISDYGLNFKINSKINVNWKETQIFKDLFPISNKENKFDRFYRKKLAFAFLTIIFLIANAIGYRCLIRNLKRNEILISAIFLESLIFISSFSFLSIYVINCFLLAKTYNKFLKIIYIFVIIVAYIKGFCYDYVFIDLILDIKKRRLTRFQRFKLRLRVFILYLLFVIIYDLLLIQENNSIAFLYFSIMIWTPQILYNIVNNNKYIYPFVYICFSTSDIIFIFYHFYLLEIYEYKYIFIICSIYILLSIVILYLQAFLGPRFMLPSKYHIKEFSIYKSYKEILKDKSNYKIYNEICIICLNYIVKKEENNTNNNNNIIKNMDIHIEISNENNNSISTNRNDLISSIKDNNNINNVSQCLRVIRNTYYSFDSKIKNLISAFKNLGLNLKSILSDGLFNFYIIKENFKAKEIMLLPCGHIYHSACLNLWLKKKEICPVCSKSIAEFLNK